MRFLLIEDNLKLANAVVERLQLDGHAVDHAGNLDTARALIDVASYDLILLDIMLPDGNGLDVLHLLKEEQSEAGILIISAKNSLDDRVQGLELGADDYLTKPFHLSELNARLKAIYRRRKFQGFTEIKFNEISVDTNNHEVNIEGRQLELTVKEYELLLFFISNKNRVLTKQTIAEHRQPSPGFVAVTPVQVPIRCRRRATLRTQRCHLDERLVATRRTCDRAPPPQHGEGKRGTTTRPHSSRPAVGT